MNTHPDRRVRAPGLQVPMLQAVGWEISGLVNNVAKHKTLTRFRSSRRLFVVEKQ